MADDTQGVVDEIVAGLRDYADRLERQGDRRPEPAPAADPPTPADLARVARDRAALDRFGRQLLEEGEGQ